MDKHSSVWNLVRQYKITKKFVSQISRPAGLLTVFGCLATIKVEIWQRSGPINPWNYVNHQ